MSYNLLFDTNFNNVKCSTWKLTNCDYVDGYIVGRGKIYSVEQEITLPDITKLYASFEYLTFDRKIKYVYCGIVSGGEMSVTRKRPSFKRRKRVAVVVTPTTEKITVMYTFHATSSTSRIYIDSPLLVDLEEHKKTWWPIHTLDRILDYRYGFSYHNIYKESELTIDNNDFSSPFSQVERGKTGLIVTTYEKDWFELNLAIKKDVNYLIKLDYKQINDMGSVALKYGDYQSVQLNEEQQYMIFKGATKQKLRLYVQCNELLPYIVNLKHILVIDLTGQRIEEHDLPYLPFV